MKIVNNIDKNIFREYDIRGTYNVNLNEDVSYTIGKAYGTYIKRFNETICVVGHDNRLSSFSINESLIEGILSTGINVVDIGLVTTPMLYFARILRKTNASIMVTASHNPKDDNGFKISFNSVCNAKGEEIFEFRDFLYKFEFDDGNGKLYKDDIKNQYFELFKRTLHFGNRRVKAVVDCGNGTTSIVAKDIFVSNDNIEYIPLFAESDGTFPNHHPDPAVESNLTILKEKVKELHADCGIAFDGDGDRVGVVNEKGEFVSIDKFMVIIWRDIYNKIDKKEGFYDVKCSKVVSDEMIKLGLKPIEVRTGNSYTKKISVDNNYPFGGELSGHLYFRDKFIGTDDGIYAGLRLVEILSHNPKKVSKLLEGITKYYNYPEGKFTVEDSKKDIIVSRVEEYCKEKGYNYSKIDGIKVLYDDGFALVRKSNTGPNITTRYESSDKEKLELIKQEFDSLIIKYSKE